MPPLFDPKSHAEAKQLHRQGDSQNRGNIPCNGTPPGLRSNFDEYLAVPAIAMAASISVRTEPAGQECAKMTDITALSAMTGAMNTHSRAIRKWAVMRPAELWRLELRELRLELDEGRLRRQPARTHRAAARAGYRTLLVWRLSNSCAAHAPIALEKALSIAGLAANNGPDFCLAERQFFRLQNCADRQFGFYATMAMNAWSLVEGY